MVLRLLVVLFSSSVYCTLSDHVKTINSSNSCKHSVNVAMRYQNICRFYILNIIK
jgi:hypothetical protein